MPALRKLGLVALALCALTARAESFDPLDKSILELQLAMALGQTSSAELVDFYLERIASFDQQGPALNSMAFLNPAARETAEQLDRERKAGELRGPLHGIPLVVKDNYQTDGMPTEAGSLTLKGFSPDEDAELVSRLRKAGAIILGKTNMHEYAYGIESIGSSFGAVRNPYDPTRNPGGSSGGTGAAVAANFAVAGLGSDTCGSIQDPSAHNALVGLRGTQGSSSRHGIIPLSSTQDIGGPLAHKVSDLALLLDVTTGYDPKDPQTAASVGKFERSFSESLNPDAMRGARIGVVTALLGSEPEDEEVAAIFRRAMQQAEALGAELVEVSVPRYEELFEVRDGFYVLLRDFAVDINAYLAAHPDAPVSNIDEILASGLVVDSVAALIQESANALNDPAELYLSELAKRNMLQQSLLGLMARSDLDALAFPTLPRKAAPLGEPQPGDNCHLASISGFPAITLPAGFTPDGLPVGLELLGRPWEDAALVGLAYGFEQATRHRRLPALGN